GGLLHTGQSRHAAQADAQVLLADEIAIADLVRHRHLAVAHLNKTRLAAEAEDVDVVAVFVGRAAAEEGGGIELARQLASQRLAVLLVDAGAEASDVVRLAPAAGGIQAGHHLLHHLEHVALAVIATGLLATARATAAHPSSAIASQRCQRKGALGRRWSEW